MYFRLKGVAMFHNIATFSLTFKRKEKDMGDLGDDFRAFREYQREIREEKYTKFCSKTLPRLKESSKVIHIEGSIDKFTITTTDFGIIDVFPKANRLLIRKDNKWHSRAVHWIINNLL